MDSFQPQYPRQGKIQRPIYAIPHPSHQAPPQSHVVDAYNPFYTQNPYSVSSAPSRAQTQSGDPNLAVGAFQGWQKPFSYQRTHQPHVNWADTKSAEPWDHSLQASSSAQESFVAILFFLQQDCIEPILEYLVTMADPLSITASILSVAGAGIKLTTALYTLVDSVRNANVEIELITNEITIFSCTLDEVHGYLEGSQSLYSDNLMSNLKKLLETCTRLYSDMEKTLKVGRSGRSYQLTRNLMWALRREKIRPMRLNLESLKTTLMVMLQTMKLAKYKGKIHQRKMSAKKITKEGNRNSVDLLELQKLRRDEGQARLRAEASVIANYWAILRSQEASQAATQQGLLTQGPGSETSSSMETNLWLWQVVPYRPPSNERRFAGRVAIKVGNDDKHPKAEGVHTRASKTVNQLVKLWTNEDSRERVTDLPVNEHDSGIAAPQTMWKGKSNVRPDQDRRRSKFGATRRSKARAQRNESPTSDGNQRSRTPVLTQSPPAEDPPSKDAQVEFSSLRSTLPSETVSLNSQLTGSENAPASATPALGTTSPEPGENDQTATSETDDGEDASEGALETSDHDSDSSSWNKFFPDSHDSAFPRDASTPNQKSNAGKRPARRRPSNRVESGPEDPDSMIWGEEWEHHDRNRDPFQTENQFGPHILPATDMNGADHNLPNNQGLGTLPPFNPPVPPYYYPGYQTMPPAVPAAPPAPEPVDHSEQFERLEKLILDHQEQQAAKEAVELKRKAEEDAKNAAREKYMSERERAVKDAEDAAKRGPDTKQVLKLKDAIGRKFVFPFHQCRTWEGIHSLICSAFLHVETLGPHVDEGHYDLSGPSGDLILPSTWETIVEPGWAISMSLWPIAELAESLVDQSVHTGEEKDKSIPSPLTPVTKKSKKQRKKEKIVPEPRNVGITPPDPPSKRPDAMSKKTEIFDDDTFSIVSSDVARSEFLRLLEEVELSDLQQWIEDKRRAVAERAKQVQARDRSLDNYSNHSLPALPQQSPTQPGHLLRAGGDVHAISTDVKTNTEEQLARMERLLLESKHDQERKEEAKHKSEEQARIDDLCKQIAEKQAEIDAREEAAKAQRNEEKFARIERLIIDRNQSQSNSTSMPLLTAPASNQSRPESSKSERRSLRDRIFSRGS